MKQPKLLFVWMAILLLVGLTSCSEEDKSVFGDDFEIPELTDANTIQFTVDATNDWKQLQVIASGQKIAIEWGDGRLQKVANPNGLAINYRYGNLKSYRVRIWAEELMFCNIGDGLVSVKELKIGYLPQMKDLVLNSFKETKRLDIGRSCPNLETANIGNFADLESVNWEGCSQIEKIQLYSNPKLITRSFGDLPKLKELAYIANGETALTISGLPALEGIGCPNSKLESLTLKDLPKLALIECTYNELTSLSLKGLSNLRSLSCSNNPQLSAIDFDDNSAVSNLSIEACAFRSIDFLDKLLQLDDFDCSFNQLTELNLSANGLVVELYCHGNRLESLLLPNPNNLREVSCFSNRLSASVLNTVFGQLNSYYQLNHPYSGYLSFYDNPGAKDCNSSILNNKGWKIIDKK